MSVWWRLASGRHDPLSGEGARLVGGRWNSPGRPVIYASESLALSLAENLVHITGALPFDYVWIKLALPDDAIEHLYAGALKNGWSADLKYTRALGDKWLREERSLGLTLPSAILPESTNIVINPLHTRAAELQVISREPFKFDPRLRR